MRTARSRTSGENLFDLVMAPSSQTLEPPQIPGRFRCGLTTMTDPIWPWADSHPSSIWPWLHNGSTSETPAKGEDYRIKPFIGQIQIHSPAGLQNALNEMRRFFNHVRTHQNLPGLTPAEAWAGLPPTALAQTPPKSTQLVHALDGLLVGYHIRR